MNEAESLILGSPDDRLAEAIFRCHHEALYFYTVKMTKKYSAGRHQAMDILQDIYMKVHADPGKFREGYRNSKIGYLYKALRRRIIDLKRKSNTYKQLKSAKGEQTPSSADLLHLCPDEERREIYEILNDALREPFLTPMKLYVDGYSYPDIAEELGVSINTVSSRISRARDALEDYCKVQNEQHGANYPDFSRFRRKNKPNRLFDESSSE